VLRIDAHNYRFGPVEPASRSCIGMAFGAGRRITRGSRAYDD
jgi:hypothetical protein